MTLKCTSWHEKSGGKNCLCFFHRFCEYYLYIFGLMYSGHCWTFWEYIFVCVCDGCRLLGSLEANEADKTVRDTRIKMRGNHSEHRRID